LLYLASLMARCESIAQLDCSFMKIGINFPFQFLLAGFWLTQLCPAVAENLVPSGDFENPASAIQWARPDMAIRTEEEHATGIASLRFRTRSWATSPELVEVDPERSYVLRVFIKEAKQKEASGSHPLTVFVGLRLLDENEKELSPYSVSAVPNTDAILSRDASEGDKVLHIEGNLWKNVPKGLNAIVFDAKEDRSDIPNNQSAGIAEITAGNGGAFEVHLKGKLSKGYPAGTRVRQHRYADFPVIKVAPEANWEAHVHEIGSVSRLGVIEAGKFWPGVRYVRPSIGVFILDAPSVPSSQPVDLLIDDVTFTCVD
jgi:hypothetical protein